MTTIAVIPARFKSTRLPQKIILDLKGKPVIQRVFDQCRKVSNIDQVFIAVDNKQVFEICKNFTDNVVMTKESHLSGTDRIAEAVEGMDCDNVINVQGDEPFLPPELIELIVDSLVNSQATMVSAMHRIKTFEELNNPNVVKVIVNGMKEAIYFSRATIPFRRAGNNTGIDNQVFLDEDTKYYRHIGIYGYERLFLNKFVKLEPSFLEKTEKLEQLRALENGYKINMIETEYESVGIDTMDDYKKALDKIL